jgi:DNA modification methylase
VNSIVPDSVLEGAAEEVLGTMSSDSVDIILTDIPYGIHYKSNKQNYDTREASPVVKDREEYFQTIVGDDEIPLGWLPEAYRTLKTGAAMYVFCHWSTWHLLYPAVLNVGFTCKNMLVMNKSNHGMGDLKGQYAPKHELLMFAVKGRHLMTFESKRMNDVWDVPVKYSGAVRLHPNEKPLSWLEPCIKNSSKVGDLVVDPFCGSGTTAKAAKGLGRRYIVSDLDPKYVEVARTSLSSAG